MSTDLHPHNCSSQAQVSNSQLKQIIFSTLEHCARPVLTSVNEQCQAVPSNECLKSLLKRCKWKKCLKSFLTNGPNNYDWRCLQEIMSTNWIRILRSAINEWRPKNIYFKLRFLLFCVTYLILSCPLCSVIPFM